ncbi:MAG: NAD(P)H-dependent oxidoreductase subunit E [Solirubrobacterales bacterium]|nr:NAD(P)H-dependent oxidoreductase subunit E [Solirubrobacterales bacterium]MBV9535730.1 NAD(P)H-dependent oxidoreductase subunit E [Solirubrobacterales bacterium]
MDVRLLDAEPTTAERAAVDAFLGPPLSTWVGADRADDGHAAHGGHSARAERHQLLPTLHALHERVGWISPGALNYIARRLTIPPADVYGVTTFYALFSLEPRAPRVLHVCNDAVCRCCAGSDSLVATLAEQIGPQGQEVGGVTWLESPCLGQCDRAPAALVVESGESPREVELASVTADGLLAVMDGQTPAPPPTAIPPQAGQPGLALLKRIGVADPESLDDYRAHGGYEALRRAFELGPDGVIEEMVESKLVGRGGAAFPTGRKWDAVARQPRRPHYMICNADESEPGTFKDRAIMEGDPFSLIESMTIAAYASGCERGYIYIRGEYPLAQRRLERAVEQARARGLLGDDILSRGVRFDIELRKGAGAYICGEETALFASVEGYRGEPRNKPPFPVDRGLFGKPTVVNNVETLVNVLPIVLKGGAAFARIGTERSTGPKLFCVCGAMQRPGTYEVPFGTTLRELLELAGGVAAGSKLRAVLLGGAAGSFITPDELELALTFEDARAAGTTLGSGVVLAVDERVDLPELLAAIAAFFRDESCGQCVPCRVGTVRQEEALARLRSGRTRGSVQDELALIAEIGEAMRDASICGLGQTASSAIESAMARLNVFNRGVSA